MRLHQLNTDQVWETAEDGERFIVLGPVVEGGLSAETRRRIKRETAAPQRETWGTFGRWDDSFPEFGGRLEASAMGNIESHADQSGHDTVRIIDAVNEMRATDLKSDEVGRVTERFIDLRHIRTEGDYPASVTLESMPCLRLTLFVQPGEGALVFAQRARRGTGTETNGAVMIQPEGTPHSSCSGRDRLDYRVPVWPRSGVTPKGRPRQGLSRLYADEAAEGYDNRLVLKILTFRRANSSSHEVLRRALRALGREDHALLAWRGSSGRFESVSAGEIDLEAKTLLMLHGTFMNTAGSFRHLTDPSQGAPWMHKIATNGRYPQILAFDHDTVLSSLKTNEGELNRLLGGPMKRPVDVITHSRGGLLAKHLAIRGTHVQVERAAMTACANGVGYFTALRNVSWFLTALGKIGNFSGVGSVAVALAQHSAEVVLGLPGLKAMIPGSPELNAVARRPVPTPRRRTRFLPIVGDWESKSTGWFRDLGPKGVDLFLKAILGSKHDWVVGSSEQSIVAPGHGVPVPMPLINALHTRYHTEQDTRDRMEKFLI